MPHTALYRKIRPRAFREILGQPHIVRALSSQLVTGQVSHAYLFCGTRGTGKTSAAKIFARAINCLAPENGEPCNTCEMCASILAERCLDVAEIDAASNNGVDNIRDLREEVRFLPTSGRYKVYIVDEVHMLSGAAFNALLKTLEEPPAHVIFILATTDPQKIPATILSRCQRYDFRRISSEQMTTALAGYLNKEGIAFEDGALDYIAYHSDGAMRDALSLLDQCLSLSADGLTLAKVRDLLGAVDKARLFEFTDALAAHDAARVLEIIDGAMADGRDVMQFAADLVRHFRDVLVAGLAGGGEFSADEAAKLAAQAKQVPADALMRYISAFSEIMREMKFAPHMRTAFEVCALKICMPAAAVAEEFATRPTPSVAPKVAPRGAQEIASKAQESAAQIMQKPAPQATPTAAPAQSKTPTAPANAPPVAAASTVVSEKTPAPSGVGGGIVASWPQFCRKLPASIRFICAKAGVEEINGMLKISCDNETSRSLLEGKTMAIREALADFFSLETPPNLAIEVSEAYNKPVKTSNAPPSQAITPPIADAEPTIPSDWASFAQEVVGGEDF